MESELASSLQQSQNSPPPAPDLPDLSGRSCSRSGPLSVPCPCPGQRCPFLSVLSCNTSVFLLLPKVMSVLHQGAHSLSMLRGLNFVFSCKIEMF